jgi:hypothetical protein
MPARKTASAKLPPDLAGKRPAQIVGRTPIDDEDDGPIGRLRREVAAEAGDGSIVITLKTALGEADIRVPPFSTWRSVARNALMTRDDDLTWAQRTLSPADTLKWMELDPTQAEAQAFFGAWGEAVGQSLGEQRASRNSSTTRN